LPGLLLLLAALPLGGCVFNDDKRSDPGSVDPGQDAWDADGTLPLDVGEDASPEPGMDPGGDTMPFDVPPDSDATCAAVPGPESVNFEVFGFPTEGSDMPPWGQGVLEGDGTLDAIEQTRSGWRYVFQLAGGKAVTVETNLPQDQSIPFAVGDAVHLYARQDLPWWRDVVLVLWAPSGAVRFLFQDAARTGETAPWFDCGGGSWLCPTVRMQADECPAVDGECGKRQYPPVELLAFGGVADSEVPVAHRQGFEGPSTTNPMIRYHVYEAYRIQPGTYQCADYPDAWIRASIRVLTP
jgi:hypothetical protein